MTGVSSDWAGRLLADGFCVIPGLSAATEIARIDKELDADFACAAFSLGHFYGLRTKRIGSLLRRSRHVARLVLDATILETARAVLGPSCDRFQLNVAQGIEIHPGEIEQFPHRDHDMWPCPKNGREFLLNLMWPLTPFTRENGATRIWPGSHRWDEVSSAAPGTPVIAECDPGSAICFLGSTLHAAGANRSPAPRRGLVIGYSLGWLKPYENASLAYPPQVARHFPPELAQLAGYAQHRPNLGNFEGACPSILLGHDVPSQPRAADCLTPEQQAAVAAFAREREALR